MSKTAFVHCRVMPGGALKVFEDLISEKKSEENNIFTIFSDRDFLVINGMKIKIITALPKIVNKFFLWNNQKQIPVLKWVFDYRNLMFFYPSLMKILSKKILKFGSKNIVISSFAVAKNLEFCKKNPKKKYLKNKIHSFLYLHSPMQYIRSHHTEYLGKITGLKKVLFQKITNKLRKWDQSFTKFDEVVANSHYTAELAKEIYGIEAEVKYPQIGEKFRNGFVNEKPSNYFLYVGRLTKLVKEVDKIIELFNKVQEPLLILGSGPDELELKAMAGNSIIFLGRIEDEAERVKIIQDAKGVINLTKESFGISNAEALLLGVPVFGFNGGASKELIDAESGILVEDKKIGTLVEKFQEFQNINFDRRKIAEIAREKFV